MKLNPEYRKMHSDDFGGNERARELELHEITPDKFFGQEDEVALIDESTGERIKEVEDLDTEAPESVNIEKPDIDLTADVLGMDDAEKWLRENDPNYKDESKNWGK